MDTELFPPDQPPVLPPPPPPLLRRTAGLRGRTATIVTVAGLATGAFAGGFVIAHAATSPSPPASSSSSSGTGTGTSAAPSMPAHGSAAHENAETAVTGANATKAQAAAVPAAGGGTAGAVTTDFTKSGYEVTVTKSDGTTVEIHLDSSFNVIHGRPGGPGRPNDNDSDDTASGGTSDPGA